jgi:DNA ligase-4
MKCYSFFKVGGGFKAADYARIKHMTEGKWHDWDKSKPPTEFIKLGGGDRQFERPDQWIKPCDSVVLEVKAASVGASEQFATKYTLRFPRFKKLREDKTWQDGLSTYEFVNLKEKAEAEKSSKEFEVDTSRKGVKKRKKELVIVGNDTNFATAPYGSPKTKIFEGLNFCVLSEMLHPVKKSKGAVEQIIKDNGGSIFASAAVKNDMICIGEKQVVRVASLIQAGHTNILRPAWILDTIHQAERDGPDRPNFLLPFEPGHMFHTAAEQVDIVATNVDEYGDSYARDVTSDDLRRILDDMIHPKNSAFDASQFLTQLEERERGLGELSSEIFRRCVVRFVSADASTSSSSSSSVSCHDSTNLFIAKNQFLFAGGRCADDDDDAQITHFVIEEPTPAPLQSLKQHISRRGGPMPRIVGLKWLTDSWDERTLLDEESYIP